MAYYNKYLRKYDYLIVFIILMMSVGANFIKNTTILRLPILILLIFILYRRKLSTELGNFKLVLVFHILHALLIFVSFGIDPIATRQYLTYLSYFVLLIISFYAGKSISDFWSILINTVYTLSIISLILFIVQLFIPYQLFAIMKKMEFYPLIGTNNPVIANIYIFTLRIESAISRNSGFAWEPGAYSIILIITILIHLLRNNLKIDRKVLILTISVLTTLSTVGYLGLVFIGIFYLINQTNKTKRVIGIFISLPTIYIISSLEFMTTKIEQQIIEQSNITENNATKSTGRFGSFILDINDWKESPLIGKGINLYTRYEIEDTEKFHRVNGVSTFLLKFGIAGFIIMLINFYFTAKLFCQAYNYKGTLFIAFIFLILNFSHNLLTSPMFLLLQFYHLHSYPLSFERRVIYQRQVALNRGNLL